MQYRESDCEMAATVCLRVPAQHQYHMEQSQNVKNCVCKLKEFLDVAESVSPEYEDFAVMQCVGLMREYYKARGKG